MPKIYIQGQYERLQQWYESLPLVELEIMAVQFQSDLGPHIPGDENFEDKCDDRWNRLPVEDQERIYRHFNPGEENTGTP